MMRINQARPCGFRPARALILLRITRGGYAAPPEEFCPSEDASAATFGVRYRVKAPKGRRD